MKKMSLIMLFILLLLMVVTSLQGGYALVLEGLHLGLSRLGSVIVLVAAAYLISGFAGVLFTPKKIEKGLGSGAGLKGIMTMLGAGALTPGGPYVFYPIAASLSRAGAKTPLIIVYLAGKTLWDVWRIPMEFALLGAFITLGRWQVTFFIPFLIGFAVLILSKSGNREADTEC